ncbi:AAA family ATPase [Prevotella sp. 10(H)]|uniref:AAA family ATPase n=1 Tax=Prevotella sp. 10(H) TaxID=1158294 RepID=UPI0004A71938|nr:AAA family ATPase [Prevotella sp. 10(H)]
MILSALKYTRYVGEPREWSIVGSKKNYAYFGNINLLVGKNASGKSRTLNVIREIAELLSGKKDLKHAISPSEIFDMVFTDTKNNRYNYKLSFKNRIVTEEILTLNNKVLLNRNKKILLNAEGENVDFTLADGQIAIALCDADNKPYFENFVTWGESLKNYLFANQAEKKRLVKDYTQVEKGQDPDDPDVLIYTFYRGRKLFGDTFISEIKAGMHELGYDISDIDIEETANGYGLYIEEEGEYVVSQREMSQGMFRALSLLIMLGFARMSDLSFCLLVDDMGEGLDFDASKKMMDQVIRKVNKSNMQFFMTSNDRNVMNQISLRYWSIIDRESTKSIFYDYTNSKETFDDFKYTGLNNFDFLSTDFYKKGFGVIDEENEG